MGKGTCATFRQNWMNLVEKVIPAIPRFINQRIKQLLTEPRFENYATDYGILFYNCIHNLNELTNETVHFYFQKSNLDW